MSGQMHIAIDDSESLSDWAAGDVYASFAGGSNAVYVFHREANNEEHYVTELPVPVEPGAVAVDASNGDVLVAYRGHVDELEPTAFGQWVLVRRLTGTPSGPLGEISALAVDGGVGGSGDIYVAEEYTGVIDHFSPEGVYLGQLTGTPSGPFGLAVGMAIDPASHDLYVSSEQSRSGAAAVDIFGPTVVVPDVTTSPPSIVGLRRATLEGTVNPDEAGAATCQFEWGTSESFGQVAPCSEGVANGHIPVAVHAELAGLQRGTTYYYRLQASNGNGTNPGEASQDHGFTTLGPPIVREASASGVTSTSATLEAEVNPNNSPTSYYIEYGTTASYGSSVPAPPGVGLGSGESFVGVSVHLQGLPPGTTYHYRVVAVSEPEGERLTAESSDEVFTTQAAGTEVTLPDGRAWEMVTPSNKHGAAFYGVDANEGADIQAAADGGAITYAATAPLVSNPAGSRALEKEQGFSTREAPGVWGTADIATAHNEGRPSLAQPGHDAEYKLFSSDLSVGVVEPAGDTPLPPLPAGSEKTIYFREASGAYRALVSTGNVPPGTEFGGDGEGAGAVEFVSASPDLSHVVVVSSVALEEGAPSKEELYEWVGGRLRLVSVLPGGEPSPSQFTSLGDQGRSGYGDVRHAISNDGSRIVWEEFGYGEKEQNRNHYYLRDVARGETVRIDAAQGAPEPEKEQSAYATANGEGSRVFFTSADRLTADSTGGGSGDLYVFEMTSGAGEPLAGRLTDLTVDSHAGEAASVGGVIGASEDGTYIYFEATGALGGGATGGSPNLYVEHYEEATRTWAAPRFIAASGDGNAWGNGSPALTNMTSRVSPDGRYLAFMSSASLTGYENRDAITGVPDQEVFLYDAASSRLVCASCDPTGARPVGVTESNDENPLWDAAANWGGTRVAASIPGWTSKSLSNAVYQSRYLSDSGRLFFDSSDALVPADTNGQVDVYEYEPAGVGGCRPPGYGASASVVNSASVGGCVGLISAGTSSQESAFLDASETGGDVFFLTTSKLSPQDYDQSYDIYDAHECTAVSPCAPPALLTRPPCTTGDACKAAPTPQPTLFGAPSSETFSGAGNVTPSGPAAVETKAKPARCRRGDVKRHGACVKRRRVKSKKAKKANRRAK